MLMRETAKEVCNSHLMRGATEIMILDWLESELCWNREDVERRLHHQGMLNQCACDVSLTCM